MAFPEVETPFHEGIFDRVKDLVIPQAKPPKPPGEYSIDVTWNCTFDSNPPPNAIPPGKEIKHLLHFSFPCLVTLNDAGSGVVYDQDTVNFDVDVLTWDSGPIWFAGTCNSSVTLHGDKIAAAIVLIHTPGGMNGGTLGSDNNVSAQASQGKQSAAGHAIDTDAPSPGHPGNPDNFIASLIPGNISLISMIPDFETGVVFFGGAILGG